jgi:hypothetical protein
VGVFDLLFYLPGCEGLKMCDVEIYKYYGRVRRGGVGVYVRLLIWPWFDFEFMIPRWMMVACCLINLLTMRFSRVLI